MANVANRNKQIYYPLLELFVSRQMDRKMMQGLVSFKILSITYVCITWAITNATIKIPARDRWILYPDASLESEHFATQWETN